MTINQWLEPADCSLDAVNMETEREATLCTGEHYHVPVIAVVSGMCRKLTFLQLRREGCETLTLTPTYFKEFSPLMVIVEQII